MTPQELLKQLRRNLDEDYTARPNSRTPQLLASDMAKLGQHLQNILITQRQILLITSRAIIAILQERFVAAGVACTFDPFVWPDHCLTGPKPDHSKGKNPNRFGRRRRAFWRVVNPL